MHVALDATPLTVPTGGVRRYVEQLHAALTRLFPEDRYSLVSDQIEPRPVGINRRWWLIGLRREMERTGADLFHGTDFAVPYLPSRPSVVTLHDLSPWREDASDGTSARVRFRTPWLLRLKLAGTVITPSAAVKKEAVERFHLRPERVVPIPLAAHGFFRPVEVEGNRRDYFVCVSTIERRKNLETILEAWREVRKSTNVDLILAGRLSPALSHLSARNEPGLSFRGPVAEAELPALYSGALAALYPSLYEGFGLPVLEAMQCGAMTITSKDPAITETAGGAALQVDALDVRGWVAALKSALDPAVRADWRERGLRRAAGFSWDRTASMTREVYGDALRRS